MYCDIFDNSNSTMNPTFILIDGSYFCFYRYYSIMNWWKKAFPYEKLEDPIHNSLFMDKYIKTFVDCVKDIPKKLNIDKSNHPILIVGKDCKRENIWRNEICKTEPNYIGNYKGNRKNSLEHGFLGGPVFHYTYENELFCKGGCKSTLFHEKLEADDCIAISVKYILNKYPNAKIYIITSDKDYLQLAEERVEIYNLFYKKLTEQKSSTGDAKTDLFLKIVLGDPSDNIKPIFKKFGPKKGLKCYQDPVYFETLLKENNAYSSYNFNKKLVDFNEIPESLTNEFISNVIKK